jgi:hypothetical protein
MEPSDAEQSALMNHLERTIPAAKIGDVEKLLGEAKQIFDAQQVVYFLRQGTCLGAVRDHALIPWDDDVDLGSIFGMHGFTEAAIEPCAAAFREIGCHVEVHREGLYTTVKIFKYRIRIDWQCYHVVKGTIAHYPGVPFPVSLFEKLTTVDFIGDKYPVPSPPEDYLQFKYGPDWRTPKQIGYEKDVLDNMPHGTVPGRAGRFRQYWAVRLLPGRAARLLILDSDDQPVAGARVEIAGLNQSRTNRRGYAKFYLPGADNYAVTIGAGGGDEVLYEEAMAPGRRFVYRPDPAQPAGRYFVLTEE